MLVCDITESSTQDRILEELNKRVINTIVSDISPDITGNWDVDQAIAMTLVADVLDFSLDLLCKGGSFTSKVFQGVGIEELITSVKPYFSEIKRFSLEINRFSLEINRFLLEINRLSFRSQKISFRNQMISFRNQRSVF